MLAQFIYDKENLFYEKKIKISSKFFSIFFSFLDTLHTQEDSFALLGQYSYILLHTWRATCPFDPQKMLYRGSFYKASLKEGHATHGDQEP